MVAQRVEGGLESGLVVGGDNVGGDGTTLDRRIWLDAKHEVLPFRQTQPRKTSEETDQIPTMEIDEFER